MSIENPIENFLARGVLKQAAKGWGEWRTTEEIAEACRLTVKDAEDQLSVLAELGLVEFDTDKDLGDLWASPLTLEEAQAEFPNYLA